jgi:hypothetical protein
MIDEKLLQERLTAAAAAQDDLLPRALEDDLAGGRRRLRRRQLLTGGGVTAAVAAVAMVGIGVTSWLTPNAGPLPDKGPVAGQSSKSPRVPPTSIASDPDATRDTPIPAEQEPPVPAKDATFNRNLTAAIYAHLDPGKKHLDFSSGGFTIDRQQGTIFSGGNRIGWRMPGQKGAEGYVALGVQPKTRTPKPCGSTSEPRMTCHSVTLPNGRTAQLGRKGDAADVLYQQPDGEWIDVSVSTLFGNNSQIPVHDLGITDQMLLALVQDNRLNLPSPAEDAKTKSDKPTQQQVHAAAVRVLPGGTLTDDHWIELPESLQYKGNWSNGQLSATVWFNFQKAARFDCPAELNIPSCTQTTSGGKKVLYGEHAAPSEGYTLGGTYTQADGDAISFRIVILGAKTPLAGVAKQQILSFLTDPNLGK